MPTRAETLRKVRKPASAGKPATAGRPTAAGKPATAVRPAKARMPAAAGKPKTQRFLLKFTGKIIKPVKYF